MLLIYKPNCELEILKNGVQI